MSQLHDTYFPVYEQLIYVLVLLHVYCSVVRKWKMDQSHNDSVGLA